MADEEQLLDEGEGYEEEIPVDGGAADELTVKLRIHVSVIRIQRAHCVACRWRK